MSCILDRCAELEQELYVQEIGNYEAFAAYSWLNKRLQNMAGSEVEFPRGLLPQTGLACYCSKKLLAAAFLYLERSTSIAVCGWCIANPGNSPRESAEAVELLLRSMPEYARKHGATYLLTTFGRRSINRIARKVGFLPGEIAENMYMPLLTKGE